MDRWCGGVEECPTWPEGFTGLRFLARKKDDGADRIAVKDRRRNEMTGEKDEWTNLLTFVDLTVCWMSTVVLEADVTILYRCRR